ncbi:hypothetical protein pb186bvf_004008 [Paramecium bursaria]
MYQKTNIDMNTIDKLLQYTRSTHQDSPQAQRNTTYYQDSSIVQRNTPQKMRQTNSMSEKDLCQVYMFLMACEIERLRDQLQSKDSSMEHIKNIEGLQSSINQWRLKYQQKEDELDDLRSTLLQKNDQDRRVILLEQQVKMLQNENAFFKQNHSELQAANLTIDRQKQEIQQLQRKVDQLQQNQIDNNQLNSIMQELDNLQQKHDSLLKEYKNFKQQKFEQHTEPRTEIKLSNQITTKEKPLSHFYQTQETQGSFFEPEQTTQAMKELIAENQKLKQELYKQSRRENTWCC